jgi:hypothetical protein
MNLASLLNTSADSAKRPIPLNDGTYFGTIKSHEFIESKQKKTPGVQYNIELTHAHDDVDLTGYDEDGAEVQLNPAGKNFRYTLWLSENSMFMLKEFIKSFGITVEGRSFAELIPQVVGQPVVVDIVKSPRTDGSGFYNDIAKVAPAAA